MRLPRILLAHEIRRRTRNALRRLPMDRFRLRVARTVEDHEDAYRLVRMSYVVEGYLPTRGPEMRISPQHVLPEATVWIATEDDQIVGTMTVVADSPAGLPLDDDYRCELDVLRRDPRTRLVEFGALAVVKRARASGVLLLLQMASAWFTRNVIKGTHIVCGVNPRGVPFHREVFGFHAIGTTHDHAGLRAPVQGLAAEVAQLQAHTRHHFRRPLASGGLFHEHLFETLPECIEAPPADNLEQLIRWKLPRDVFRKLFIEHSDRLASLDSTTLEHLHSWRSIRTCAPPLRVASAAVGAGATLTPES